VEIGVAAPGKTLECTANMEPHHGGLSNPFRLQAGPARDYNVRTQFVFKAGRPPYGARLHVCAVVTYRFPSEGTFALEGSTETSFVLRP
jgi:hypothetical protein